MAAESGREASRISTGVAGLDVMLGGGFLPGRIYLVDGDAGTGKTTLGLQFLRAGAAAGGRALLITLLQTQSELDAIVASHGWHLDGIEVRELPEDVRQAVTTEQTVFEPAEVELSEATDAIRRLVREYNPDLLFIDSLSELAALVDTGFQLKRQILRLKSLLDTLECTTLLSVGPSGGLDARMLETLVHGVIHLDMQVPPFGRAQRRLLVSKMRGMPFQDGYHDALLVTGGLEVFARIEAKEPSHPEGKEIPSGKPEIDALLGGGLREGTTCVMSGTSGAGKSSLAALYAYSGARRGVKSAFFCFDERPETFYRRTAGLGMPVENLVGEGLIEMHQINAGTISSGQFANLVCTSVEQNNVKIVVIDSISGYFQSMPGQRELTLHLHELLGYLSSVGVLSILVIANHGIFGDMEADIDISYLADTVMVLRHFEVNGEVRRCIAVLKKRYGYHERTIREIMFDPSGLTVGPPLEEFSGILTGVPRYEGENRLLFDPLAGRDEGESRGSGR
ncbi:MAG: ATPase domain-containing protein [Alkalispirochaetaceae bacterium]